MSTIELVDPELRHALTLWTPLPLTADSLPQRRADLLKIAGMVPQPRLPDITSDEIRVDSAFGGAPVRVLAYRPVRFDTPRPATVHVHGGGFAAAVALYARDQPGPKFAFQHLIYPMIDDRTAARKDLHPHVGEFVWTQENNHFGWLSLLGRAPGSADVSPYAAASRAADLSRLPASYISVGGLDLFLEENMAYADRLSRAGVPVEFHMYPGGVSWLLSGNGGPRDPASRT